MKSNPPPTRERALYLQYAFLESGAGFNSGLFRDARLLVRGADERAKRNTDRLREFTDASLPLIQRELYARVPVYPELEVLTLSFSLERMREWLGPDHPVIRRLLSKESPDSLATRLIAETKLDDAEVRKRLWQGGKAAVDASLDPMIALARAVDGDARAVRKRYEDEVEAPIAAAAQRIAAARFKAYGTNVYPDATFTLRLNYGTVQGWVENGTPVEPFTHLGRAFERATGASPFKIPDSWMKVKAQLDMRTPFCISTTNDIVGGNSGSAADRCRRQNRRPDVRRQHSLDCRSLLVQSREQSRDRRASGDHSRGARQGVRREIRCCPSSMQIER